MCVAALHCSDVTPVEHVHISPLFKCRLLHRNTIQHLLSNTTDQRRFPTCSAPFRGPSGLGEEARESTAIKGSLRFSLDATEELSEGDSREIDSYVVAT